MIDRTINLVLNCRNAAFHVVCAPAESRGIERRVPRFGRHRVAPGQGRRTGLFATPSLGQPVTAPRKSRVFILSNPCRQPLSGLQTLDAGFAKPAAAAHDHYSKTTP
jgi:hypothetical protein